MGVSVSSTSSVDEGRFLPGTLVAGRYRIAGLLGRGGMGEVYRATDLTLGQAVALKFLPEATAADERALARFYNEVRIARQVTHPNVCRVYDVGQVQGLHYISMEFVDGEDLGVLLRRIGRLPTDKALETARKICAGLAAAHEKGVLHRDLKPAIHDRYLSRDRRSCPWPSSRRGVVSSRFPTGRALSGSYRGVFVLVQFGFFGFRGFASHSGQRPSVTSHSFARIQPSAKAFTED
jgi:serine/threonine protein kinase